MSNTLQIIEKEIKEENKILEKKLTDLEEQVRDLKARNQAYIDLAYQHGADPKSFYNKNLRLKDKINKVNKEIINFITKKRK